MFSGTTLSKFMRLKTQDEKTNMSSAPYASAIESVMYVM